MIEAAVVAPLDQNVASLDLTAWTRWLQEAVDPAWRPSEWSQEAWFFDGDPNNPRTGVIKCITESCWSLLRSNDQLCRHCFAAFPRSGLSREVFAATYQRPQRQRSVPGKDGENCVLERAGTRCGRPAYSRDLCRPHYFRWYRSDRSTSSADWAVSSDELPLTPRIRCIVRSCDNQQLVRGLCHSHDVVWLSQKREGKTTADRETWARQNAPYLLANQFTLSFLEDPLRWELLYGLQQRDARGGRIEPSPLRFLSKRLIGKTSLLTMSPAEVTAILDGRTSNYNANLREIARAVRAGSLEFRGMKPTDGDVWDLTAVKLASVSYSGFRQHGGQADFTEIRQPWLREVVKEWARSTKPDSSLFQRTFQACVLASDTLHARPGGGQDPAALRWPDMQAVFKTMCELRRQDDGELCTRTWRKNVFGRFLAMLDFGRQAELLNHLSGGFGRDKSLVMPSEEITEDSAGKAIPEPVIAQLDTHLDLLGAGVSYGKVAPEDVKLMMTTAYLVLRDTGRRPLEIVSLRRNCLETDGDEVTLIWDNHKKRRYGRRLLIERQTADAIRRWQARRDMIPAPARSKDYLFPAVTARSGHKHMVPGSFSSAVREWVAAIPELVSDQLDGQGQRLAADRASIFPYAFRHSYAQRHADAGVPVDVLKELMDHRQISTTMSYYKVSLERKRQAVRTMRLHTVDRSGRPAPFPSTTAYEARSVAVPFGNCTEPSNVKAGGKSCPLRFQCAGCGFYRPDPSFLPAIEEHVNSLRADRETASAMDADGFVIRNLSDQITAFTDVSHRMRKQLSDMPEEERQEIEEASAVLRKVRATRDHKLLPLTVIPPQGPPDGR
ncbi:site-specific integrase [Streptomyces sp. NBC_01478]|uniref:tyrosine-type recombinase/integrase n=1 Tax=Streptomyces sp. NBC_01478 TaxID=2903882 RepID=UPI002E3656E8|nr:tyrosine-type recombinase/integrase [Streptomyces sp. NBC_01478]